MNFRNFAQNASLGSGMSKSTRKGVRMKGNKELFLLTMLITTYLAQIHTTLLEIMSRVGKGSATIKMHNKVIKELQKAQENFIEELKKK